MLQSGDKMRKLRKNNRGFSLVEVIVSMVILAIILIPLLSQWILSARVNQKTKYRQYATTLGKNIMEGIKAYSFEEVAFQFHAVNGREFCIVPTENLVNQVSGIGFSQTDQDYQVLSRNNPSQLDELTICDENGDGSYEVQNLAGKKYYYLIKGVKEGSAVFDVRISYDANGYQGNSSEISEGEFLVEQNQFKAPNLTELDHTKTALINPLGATVQYVTTPEGGYQYDTVTDSYGIKENITYDQRVVHTFFERHKEYIETKWLEECERIGQENRKLNEEAKKNGLPTPVPVATPVLPNPIAQEQIKQKISRTTIIQVKKQGEAESVTCYYEYTFHDAIGILRDSFDDATIDKKRYTGFFPEISFDQLDSIYLFHIPLIQGEWYSELSDCVVVEIDPLLTLRDKLKVFIAEQALENRFLPTEQIKVAVEGSSWVDFYYKNDFDTTKTLTSFQSYPFLDENNISSLVEYEKEKERIYSITIQVLEKDSEEVLYTLSSTSANP